MTRGNPKITYNKRVDDGYICRQRTRMEKKPTALDDWSVVAHLVMITICLAGFLFIVSEDLFMPATGHHHHSHRHDLQRFLRTQEEKIVEFAASASAQIDSVLHDVLDVPPEDVAMPEKPIPEAHIPEPIETEE